MRNNKKKSADTNGSAVSRLKTFSGHPPDTRHMFQSLLEPEFLQVNRLRYQYVSIIKRKSLKAVSTSAQITERKFLLSLCLFLSLFPKPQNLWAQTLQLHGLKQLQKLDSARDVWRYMGGVELYRPRDLLLNKNIRKAIHFGNSRASQTKGYHRNVCLSPHSSGELNSAQMLTQRYPEAVLNKSLSICLGTKLCYLNLLKNYEIWEKLFLLII